jgi:AGZA family xanthine/uracil permease-like MFS transporter
VLALVGLALVVALHVWRIHAAILIAITATTALAWLRHGVSRPSPIRIGADANRLQAGLGGVFGFGGKAGLGIFEILFVFFVDLFDNLGTLMAARAAPG